MSLWNIVLNASWRIIMLLYENWRNIMMYRYFYSIINIWINSKGPNNRNNTGEPRLCPISCNNDNFDTISGTSCPWWENVMNPVLRLKRSVGLFVGELFPTPLKVTSSSILFKMSKSKSVKVLLWRPANLEQTPP